MATGGTLTNLDPIIRDAWIASGDVRKTFAKACPTLDLFKKQTKMNGEGKYMNSPVITQAAQAFSAGDTFATAWNRSGNTYDKASKFVISPKEHYIFTQLDGLLMATTNKRSQAFIDGMLEATQSMVTNAGNVISTLLFGNGLGSVGVVDSFPASNQIKLVNRYDALNFKRDGFYVAALNDAAAIRTVGSNGLQVTATNLNTGVVTFSATVATEATGIAAGDTLYFDTLRPAGAASAPKVAAGFAAWGPDQDPTSALFNGVDRSVDPGLYFQRVGGSGLTWRERLNNANAASMAFGSSTGERRVLIVHPTTQGEILNQMGQQVQYTEIKTENLTFNGCRVNDGIDIIADYACQTSDSWLICPDDFDTITYTDDVVELGNQIGQVVVQVPGTKGYIVQGRAIFDINCRRPGAQVRIQHNVAPQNS